MLDRHRAARRRCRSQTVAVRGRHGELSEPADAGEGGRAASLSGPQGAGFRIWQARRRPGTQTVNVPGAWNFTDLHTADVGAVASFYGGAFGWQAEISVPPGFEDAIAWFVDASRSEQPHWHVTFAVEDRDRTAAEAERLGARVLDQSDEEWSRTARIRDPQGAEFTGSQFTPPSG